VLQIAGAIGLLIPRLRRLAGLCLALLLVTMLPANVHATLSWIPFRAETPIALWLRVPIQVLFLPTIWWTSITGPPPAASLLRRIQLA
jgi:uncharacterized membrane protein